MHSGQTHGPLNKESFVKKKMKSRKNDLCNRITNPHEKSGSWLIRGSGS